MGANDGTPAASSSPDVALGTADGVTAATASAAQTDPDVEMDPVSTVTAPPTAEHISPFLLHVHQSAADMAVDRGANSTLVAVVKRKSRQQHNHSTQDSRKRQRQAERLSGRHTWQHPGTGARLRRGGGTGRVVAWLK